MIVVMIAVHERGGFLGLDRRIEVKNGMVTVTEKGVTKQRPLDPDLGVRLHTLARHVATMKHLVVPRSGPSISDSLETSVEIEEDGGRHVFQVRTGDEAPDEVWQLLGTLSDASTVPR